MQAEPLSHPPCLVDVPALAATPLAHRLLRARGATATHVTMSGSSLELAALTKLYGSTVAVDAINLRVPADSYCCLLGPSGCGKTSTLRLVAGHETATSGDIIIGATNITDLPPAARGTAMMFQSYALFPHLNAVDNVAFSLKMRGIAKARRRATAQARPRRDRRAPRRRGPEVRTLRPPSGQGRQREPSQPRHRRRLFDSDQSTLPGKLLLHVTFVE
jgi:ABC-type glutathione transport system ATPase component